jgi:hypothetical protein
MQLEIRNGVAPPLKPASDVPSVAEELKVLNELGPCPFGGEDRVDGVPETAPHTRNCNPRKRTDDLNTPNIVNLDILARGSSSFPVHPQHCAWLM